MYKGDPIFFISEISRLLKGWPTENLILYILEPGRVCMHETRTQRDSKMRCFFTISSYMYMDLGCRIFWFGSNITKIGASLGLSPYFPNALIFIYSILLVRIFSLSAVS